MHSAESHLLTSTIYILSEHTHTYTLTKRFSFRFLWCNVQKDALLSKALTVSYRKVLDYKIICSSGIYAHLPILMFSHNQQITQQQCNAQIPSDTVQKLYSVFTSYIRMEEKQDVSDFQQTAALLTEKSWGWLELNKKHTVTWKTSLYNFGEQESFFEQIAQLWNTWLRWATAT